jgi:hypothetical protein
VCADGENVNKARIYKRGEMDADHGTAWLGGRKTDLADCELLYAHQNRRRGNQ